MSRTKRKHSNRSKSKSGSKRRTMRKLRGGSLIQSATMSFLKKYINVLETRLVNKCHDYDWVQKERYNHYMHKKERKEY